MIKTMLRIRMEKEELPEDYAYRVNCKVRDNEFRMKVMKVENWDMTQISFVFWDTWQE